MTEKNLTTGSNQTASPMEATRSDRNYVRPAVDICETDQGLTLVADVPGLDEGSLEISVDQGILTIEGKAPAGSGEYLYREFNMAGYWRQFQLPDSLDAGKAKAEVRHGVLTLHLPKVEAAKPRRIEITAH
ncbi:MAG: Hsp20/alpha crystallin family protein [Desulfuromonadales bacterium]|nr:Hsp20/alpha crystallin family protein [Desulfuromonadales bacterium]